MYKLLSLFIITSLLFSCGNDDETGDKKMSGPTPVEFVVMKYQSTQQEVTVPGTILPFEMVELYSEINGRIKKINFQEGQTVSQGTTLIIIDTDILQAQRKQLQVELDLAQKDEKRKKALLDSKATSIQEYEKAQSTLANMEAQVALLNVQISKGTIKAPFAGKVGLRNVSEGAYVTPATKITSIAQNSKIKVEFAIAEHYASRIKPGQIIRLQSADDTTSILATVYATEPTVDASTRMLTVRAQLAANDNLYPGSYVTVNYQLGIEKNSILIPNSALVPVLKGQKVWVMKNGVATSVPVKTGLRTDTEIQIIGAVTPGDTIITTGLLGLREGAPVTPKTKKQ